jgi:hypothetical protein
MEDAAGHGVKVGFDDHRFGHDHAASKATTVATLGDAEAIGDGSPEER